MTAGILFLIYFASAILYMFLIFAFTEGWYRLSRFSFSHRDLSTPLSVIIPFRNEKENLIRLLETLLQQSYPAAFTEIIFVNDHSEDGGENLLKDFIHRQNIQNVQLISSPGTGKKAALQTGIASASGKLIVITDADCLPTRSWLTEIVTFYEQNHPRLILGPVIYDGERTLQEKLFSLEFMSLVASGAGSAGIGLPFMGNAANMAFEKKIYLDATDDALQNGFASGDDVFFIQYISRKFGRRAVTFIKNEETIVRTSPPSSVSSFLRQRIRWGSKARGYTQPWAMLVSYTVFFYNLMLTISFITGFFYPWEWIIYGLFIIMKTLIDFPLLYAFSRFAGKRRLLPLLFPFEIIYPFYITFVAFRSLFPYQWKNRQWKQ